MKASAAAFLFADLSVTRSHNRPCASNDNPFSKSPFKTLKHQPRLPRRFGCIEDDTAFCRQFFDCYNRDHSHAMIGPMPLRQVHYGPADAVHAARQKTLDRACRDNPERFANQSPKPPASQPSHGSIHPFARRIAMPKCQNPMHQSRGHVPPSAATHQSMTMRPVLQRPSGRAMRWLRGATAPPRDTYQPAGNPPIGPESV